MEKDQFDAVMARLARRKPPYFLSENEFQIVLAEEMVNSERINGHKDACTYLDQNKKIKDKKETMNPDIVITEKMFPDDIYKEGFDLVYVECKYITRGKYIDDGAVVRQSASKAPAPNIARLGFWEDIVRMESVDKGKQSRQVKKYAVFLTNDKNFWTKPTDEQTRNDREVRLHNGRGAIPKVMTYYAKKKDVPTNKTIRLQGEYFLEEDAWKLYGHTGFKYLLVEVKIGQ